MHNCIAQIAVSNYQILILPPSPIPQDVFSQALESLDPRDAVKALQALDEWHSNGPGGG